MVTSDRLMFPASVPKVEQIDQRLGPLVQEFKDLVYPADYNPETKPAAKRKTGKGRTTTLARTLIKNGVFTSSSMFFW